MALRALASGSPHERRVFNYDVPLKANTFPGMARASAQLLFRNLPPYSFARWMRKATLANASRTS